MKKRLTILLMLTLTVILSSSARVAHLLPRPKQVETLRMGAFMLQRNVQLHDPTHCLMLQSFLADHGCAVTANAKAVVRVELSASADVVGIYKSNIYYQQQGSPEVAGEVCALWNDHKLADDEAILRQNNFYANVIASASRAWQGGGKQYIEQGGVMLPNDGDEFDDFQDWEARFLFHKDHCLSQEPIPYVKQTQVAWAVTTTRPQGGHPKNVDYVRGAGIYLQHTWKKTVPAIYDNRHEGDTAYVWTSIYSPKEQEAGALVELQNYSRSEHDKAPVNGNWDRKGSLIWWNGKRLAPPLWVHNGKEVDNETDLANENLTGRPPLRLTLRKGWNRVVMMLPNRKAEGIRLNKWMFTFVLTDLEGRHALTGVRYDAQRTVSLPHEVLRSQKP